MEKLTQTDIEKLVKGVPKSGKAEIRLLNPKKTGSITVRDYIGENGDKRPYVDQHGNHRVLRVNKKVLLDLTSLRDRLTYEQVRLHPIYVKGANPVLKLVNHEVEDENFVLKKDLESKANGIIQGLKKKVLSDFARVMLVQFAEGSTDTAIKRKLYDLAVEDPQKIIDEWEHPDKDIKALLHAGLNMTDKPVFTKGGGVYKFKGSVMGTSFELAVEWLKDNDDLIPSIRKEIK